MLLVNYNGIWRIEFGFTCHLVEKYEDGGIIKKIQEIWVTNTYV